VLDLISDIGGLQGIIVSIFSIFIGMLNFSFFDNFLVSKLFKVQKPVDGDILRAIGGYKKKVKNATQ
jgi:hypothetical protein